MKILIVGSGGREHALAWKIAQSPLVDELFCAPGNPGTEHLATNLPIPVDHIDELLTAAQAHEVDLTVVGPEQPLVNGLADRFRAAGLAVYGPSREGAILEGSKVFAKGFMARNGIPTAPYGVYHDPMDAKAAIRDGKIPVPLVAKADGLAAGKGVLICPDQATAMAAVETIMEARAFGEAGEALVLESFLTGVEASLHIMTDGRSYIMLPSAKDHKKIFDGETGPNTGGMGAVSPSPDMDDAMMEQIRRTIVDPFMEGLRRESIDFRGTVFFGLMLTKSGPVVLEFNVRFGDPESQVILPRIVGDIVPLLRDTAAGQLSGSVALSDQHAVTVVAASQGYPGSYEKGKPISLPAVLPSHVMIFQAGTRRVGSRLETAGGRVLAVTALRGDREQARSEAYRWLADVGFDGKTIRTDIAAAPGK